MELRTLEEAASLIRARDTLAVPLGPGQPAALLHALSARDDFEELRVFGALLLDLYPLFAKPGVHLTTGFFGPAERALLAAGHDVQFVPGDFRRFAGMVEELAPRVMATAVSPPGPDGSVSLSLHAGATVDALRACGRDPERVLVAEINPGLPRTLGLPPEHSHSLGPDEVDVFIESDRPVRTLPDTEPTEIERAIAGHASAYIHDGATLQTGIGGIPSAVAGLLAHGDGGDYGIHSEMFTTGLMHLVEAGKVSNRRKGQYEGVSICTFALGTEELHRWLDGREDVRFLPVDLVNDPTTIANNQGMISINGALAVDLYGQVVADTIDGKQHSGIGGHEDFVSGASMQSDDRSLVCLPATVRVGERLVSRIQARHAAGTVVTTPRHQLDVVVTEYGAAELRGRTVKQRAEALAQVAHPSVREALLRGETDLRIA
ncbi:MAG: acetyl-CoA hydrolase/transferase family protein [Myxococcota bacterium]